MSTRYVKVPVEFGRMETEQGTLIGAFLRTGPKSRSTIHIGYGFSEDDAFVDLLLKLGYEVAQ